ncbi:putative ABC transport system permease protein [Butyrivibrio fibrisolvens]|uniref:Putative ABC transport system permease protein n=1 Tax=Butyrivibrio fibrisolvens TaxID=831 RepID=A0A1H9LXU5_BUTFI|nr:ABC transporter permease [Butyrivibrio fibrisolvens]SER16266.1 putative ABC transport system permease protein [Butyrivibrio fibrisolvens]
MTSLIQTAVELGLISSLTVLSLYLSYTMLNVCDLSTDGAFTLGAAVGAVVTLSGHPFLALPAAMLTGMLSGFVTAILQTRMGVDSLLAGITVNTGLYSINIAVMGKSSLLNLNSADNIFSFASSLTEGSVLDPYAKLIAITLIVIIVMICIVAFLRTRLGLALRATGDNPDMVRSSSINTVAITITGLCLSNCLTALSGCLLAQYNKSANIDIGTGMLTIALASLLIGRLFFRNKGVGYGVVGAVIGAIFFRLVYTMALRLNMPAFMLKLVSSVIVILAISGPYFLGKMRKKGAAHA